MLEIIKDGLQRIAKHQDVTILHAVLAGSRAHGNYTPTSDWDVRFVYLPTPGRLAMPFRKYHGDRVLIDPTRETIDDQSDLGEQPSNVEYVGTSLRAFAGSINNSDFYTYDWLHNSKPVYSHPLFDITLKALNATPDLWSKRKLAKAGLSIINRSLVRIAKYNACTPHEFMIVYRHLMVVGVLVGLEHLDTTTRFIVTEHAKEAISLADDYRKSGTEITHADITSSGVFNISRLRTVMENLGSALLAHHDIENDIHGRHTSFIGEVCQQAALSVWEHERA